MHGAAQFGAAALDRLQRTCGQLLLRHNRNGVDTTIATANHVRRNMKADSVQSSSHQLHSHRPRPQLTSVHFKQTLDGIGLHERSMIFSPIVTVVLFAP